MNPVSSALPTRRRSLSFLGAATVLFLWALIAPAAARAVKSSSFEEVFAAEREMAHPRSAQLDFQIAHGSLAGKGMRFSAEYAGSEAIDKGEVRITLRVFSYGEEQCGQLADGSLECRSPEKRVWRKAIRWTKVKDGLVRATRVLDKKRVRTGDRVVVEYRFRRMARLQSGEGFLLALRTTRIGRVPRGGLSVEVLDPPPGSFDETLEVTVRGSYRCPDPEGCALFAGFRDPTGPVPSRSGDPGRLNPSAGSFVQTVTAEVPAESAWLYLELRSYVDPSLVFRKYDVSGEGRYSFTPDDPLLFAANPVLTMAPKSRAPLAALVEASTNVPTRLRVEAAGPGHRWTVEFPNLRTEHRVHVLGFRAAYRYEVVASATAEDGRRTSFGPWLVETDPLPADFPSLSVVSDTERMEPGVTLFPVGGPGGFFAVIVDAAGEVVWFWRSDDPLSDVRRIENGNLLLLSAGPVRTRFREVNMLGGVVNRWDAVAHDNPPGGTIEINTDTVHHEVFETADGTFLTLSTEVRKLRDYRTSETDPTPRRRANIVGDVIVELEPDGAIVGEWRLLDILDPYRVGYDSFGGFWAAFYSDVDTPLDWSHANAVIHDPSDDTFIVSTRHQDAVFKFDRSGELIWILGTHENWGPPYDAALLEPVSEPFAFPFHQHAPAFTRDGTLMIFDNAVHRASPPDPKIPDTASRAVEYSIDTSTMQVSQVWEYGSGGEFGFCNRIGDADPLPVTGNVLITCGALDPTRNGRPSATIVEVTHETPATKVFQLFVEDDNPGGPARRGVYRAERLSSLHP